MNDFSNEVEPLTGWSKALSICHLLKFLFFLNVLQLARLQNALRLPRKIISKQSKAGGRGLKLGMVQKNTAGKENSFVLRFNYVRWRFVNVVKMYNLYLGNCSKLLLIVISL